MKKPIISILAVFVILMTTICLVSKDTPASTLPVKTREKTLIVFFSLGKNAEYTQDVDATTSASLVIDGMEKVGTTEYIARLIQKNIGGDLHSIQTEVTYPIDFQAVIDQNHDEVNRGYLPELKESNLDISKYDTIFIGYPVWASNAPQAIFSFLNQYDLSGKTVIPFCTHNGYGAGSSYKSITDAIPEADTQPNGLDVRASDVSKATDTVINWLTELGYALEEPQTASGETAITITIGNIILDGIIYDTALAQEIKNKFPLTISMSGYGGREYYGSVDFYPEDENLTGGSNTFKDGDITYCEAHHNMAIFYAQTDHPTLSVDVIPIGKVTSDLHVFETLPGSVEITFALAE